MPANFKLRNSFSPNSRNIIMAARNQAADRIPLYEHGISYGIMDQILGTDIRSLWLEGWNGDDASLREFMHQYIGFYRAMGYDYVNFDMNIGSFLPGSGALLGERPGVIQDRDDFSHYPWSDVPELFAGKTDRLFSAFVDALPKDMCGIGGPGNGIFECVEDLVGYQSLCYIKADDFDLYADLFKAVAHANYAIWARFLKRYGTAYGVCRFGDDLGYKSGPLLVPDDIRTHLIPGYRRIADLIHDYEKPFLWHSCGNIFEVMDDVIEHAGIDAKHSNEDNIAPFCVWVDRYGDKIGNFGGVDVDVICQKDEQTIKHYVLDILHHCENHGGIAIGTGNSVPDYVPVAGYLAMIDTVREYRGDH